VLEWAARGERRFGFGVRTLIGGGRSTLGNMQWNAKDWLRINAGVGYRLIAAEDRTQDRIRGVSASFAVQLGGS
jgi:hypothetical protein